ncbi:MAG: hypothetical protein HWN66_22430 [Candidatus Helarchaeota archaeon]|nr:hypothetical protein [Candidatus Helarchaeota archaeon]
MEILLALISVPKFILNLLSLNYIGRLETKKELLEGRIKLLEDDNKRKENSCSELLKIAQEKRELLDIREESIEKQTKEMKGKIEEFEKSIKEQKNEVFKDIQNLLKEYFTEGINFMTLSQKNRAKIEELKIKEGFDSIAQVIILKGEIDSALRGLGRKAIQTIGDILPLFAKKR